MAVVNQPARPLGASSEGVGRGRCARVLFNSAELPRKKLITKLNNLFYVFTSYLTSNAPKTMELRLPLIATSLHTPLRRGRQFLVGRCVDNHRPAAI